MVKPKKSFSTLTSFLSDSTELWQKLGQMFGKPIIKLLLGAIVFEIEDVNFETCYYVFVVFGITLKYTCIFLLLHGKIRNSQFMALVSSVKFFSKAKFLVTNSKLQNKNIWSTYLKYLRQW